MPLDDTSLDRRELDLAALRYARGRIADGHWAQGYFPASDDGVNCPAGWLVHWAGTQDALRIIRQHIVPILPNNPLWRTERWLEPEFRLYLFNDAPWRRRRRMVRLLDKAIRRIEADVIVTCGSAQP